MAIATLFFFGATWLTISRDHEEKRRQQAEARSRQDEARLDDAQQVSVVIAAVMGMLPGEVTPSQVTGVNVTNARSRQIDDVVVSIWTALGVSRGVCTIGSIASGCVAPDVLPWHDDIWGRTRFEGLVECTFVDRAGTQWLLKNDKTLHRGGQRPNLDS